MTEHNKTLNFFLFSLVCLSLVQFCFCGLFNPSCSNGYVGKYCDGKENFISYRENILLFK